MRRFLTMSLVVAALGSPASGQVAPLPESSKTAVFYNRVGATVANRDSDAQDCYAFANFMAPQQADPGNQQYGLVGAFIVMANAKGEATKLSRSIVEYADDCMIAKGYRRFQIEGMSQDDFEKQIAFASPEAALQWAGDASPPGGVVARAFTNENWLPDERDAGVKTSPARPLRMLVGAPQALFKGNNAGRPIAKPIEAKPQDGVLVFDVTGRGKGEFHANLTLVDEQGEPVVQKKPGSLVVLVGKSDQTSTRAFVVPPGRYVLENITYTKNAMMTRTNLCLGSISFVIQPGEVLHAGEIVMTGAGSRKKADFGGLRYGGLMPPKLRINAPNIEAAKAAMTKSPGLVDKLGPAAWEDGHTISCGQVSSLYFDIGAISLVEHRS